LKIRYLDIKMKRWELRASAEGMTHGISSNKGRNGVVETPEDA
jgi:hypothetical protein